MAASSLITKISLTRPMRSFRKNKKLRKCSCGGCIIDDIRNEDWGILSTRLSCSSCVDQLLSNSKGNFNFLSEACKYNIPDDVFYQLAISKPSLVFTADSKTGRYPLHVAALYGANERVIELLSVSYPEAASEPDMDGCTPLHLACYNGQITCETAELLCKAGPSAVSMKDKFQDTPLDKMETSAYAKVADKKVMKLLKGYSRRQSAPGQ
uniref:Uncharacterized protein n=1 Tax=Leptocylindrus danicus TaxID=163516 RepID=A0A7S2LGS1_9STRA|mmetsp:Transcript_4882/g.7117  ORF Transcript_4882/g.7117 Transcript_4882/m.7117 type:complete len:210 (+) Transcript_4882:87-716(+)|eukprot:CAMPEP_0116016846 /NCGR_PEP_ID=MMETSP0321-20121206/7713_1 /TAXON_ID=163516 /ORGANISM="Leptocylindrus danicus var. danicus, Strain B650" /LENGTH=209 /DNA_ID=CAMNT_0003486961 /DNA_START=1 /DNA_END=630 /DNA_ORIENTATION=+